MIERDAAARLEIIRKALVEKIRHKHLHPDGPEPSLNPLIAAAKALGRESTMTEAASLRETLTRAQAGLGSALAVFNNIGLDAAIKTKAGTERIVRAGEGDAREAYDLVTAALSPSSAEQKVSPNGDTFPGPRE